MEVVQRLVYNRQDIIVHNVFTEPHFKMAGASLKSIPGNQWVIIFILFSLNYNYNKKQNSRNCEFTWNCFHHFNHILETHFRFILMLNSGVKVWMWSCSSMSSVVCRQTIRTETLKTSRANRTNHTNCSTFISLHCLYWITAVQQVKCTWPPSLRGSKSSFLDECLSGPDLNRECKLM